MFTAVVVIAALRLGAEVFIPLTLAVLLSFLLTYPVNWLEKLKLGKVVPVGVVLLIACAAAGGMIWIGARQLADIVEQLPDYQANIQSKLDKFQNPAGSRVGKAMESLRDIGSQLSPANAAAKHAGRAASPAAAPAPVPVQVVKGKPGIFDSFGLIGGSILHFLASAAAVVILTLFILLRRGDLRNRLFRLFGQGRINVMTTALDDAAQRVSRYLLTQSMVNSTFGLLLGFGLFCIGVPYAAFWGVLGAVLRFIPYVGTLVAGLSPFLLSLAVFDGWKRPLLTLALFAGVELTMSSLVEPWLYATRTGISSLAILFSAAFWTMLWGPIGLVVSTPLTVLLFVLGRYIPQLEFLYILLGDEPVLSPHAIYYQRLLATDEDEAREVVENFLKDKSELELYDSLLIPALSLAEADRHKNHLDEERQRIIYDTTRELIEETQDIESPETEETKFTVPGAERVSVVCVAARDEADELVAQMLARVLQQAGFRAEALPAGFLDDTLSKITQCQADIAVFSALPPFAINHARSLCRKARQRCPDMKAIVGLWQSTTDARVVQHRLGSGCSEYVVHNLQEARLQLRLLTEQLLGNEGNGRVPAAAPAEPEPASTAVR